MPLQRPGRPLLPLLLSALCLLPVVHRASDTFQARFERLARESWERRTEPGGLVALLRSDDARDEASEPEALAAAVARLAQAPDTQECTRALALHILAREAAMAGRLEESDAFTARLGYLADWLVVGPFPDEQKAGFDAVYPPEEGPDFKASYEGKGHAVAWRPVPRLRGREVVPLDSLLDPTSMVAGYAATFVRVPRDTPAVLRGGFNEAVKVWVDGELVGERRVYSGRVFDQHSFPCTLRKGWNLVLVKVCNQEAGWNFSLRLTDPDGKALEGWASTSDPSAVGGAVSDLLAKDGAAPGAMAWYDPEGTLARMASEREDATSAADYAFYLALRRPFDRADLDDVRAFEEAVRRAPSDPELLCALGDAHEDHNLARKAYDEALKGGENPEALYRLADYYNRRGMPLPALGYIGRAVQADPESPVLKAFRARIRMRYVVDGLAAREILNLAREFPRNESLRRSAGHAARSLGLEDELYGITLGFRESHQEIPEAWVATVQALRSRGQAERAHALMEEARDRFPFNLALVEDEASYLIGVAQPQKARELMEEVLAWAPEWAEGQRLLGDALGALGRPKEALVRYQASLTLKPQQEALKTKVAFLNPEEAGFEASCRIPDADLPTDLSKYGEERVVVLLDNVAVEVQPSGLSSRYYQRVFQVNETGAVQEVQRFPITFDPDREEVRVLEASILKPDGTKVHAESYNTDRLSQPAYRLYYRTRNLVLSFPSLAAGDRVRIEYKVSDVGEGNEYGRYFGYIEGFSDSAPVLLKQFTLILPADFPLHIHDERLGVDPIVLTMEGRKTYRWVVRDLERLPREPDMPALTEVAPYLHVSTFDDWDAMGRWYAGFIRDQWGTTPEIRKLVGELTAGATTEEEKVRAIHRWAVQQTRYVGLEFGVHGIRPYKVRQIFERRFGDCKDKAILLAAMLREAGVDACMALVRTRDLGELAPEPASLAIFNHAICYVPGLDLFLDGTAEYSGLRELPHQDQGTWTLLVWPDGKTERLKIPEDAADRNLFEARYRIEVPASGTDGPFEGGLTFRGGECAWVRQRYQDPDRRAEVLQQDLSGNYPGTRVDSVEFSDLKDLSTPVRATFGGVLGRLARPDGEGRVSLPVWMGRLDLTARMASLVTRRYDLVSDYPWRQTYEVTYRLPEGALPEVPEDGSVETRFGSARRTAASDGRAVTFTVEVTMLVNRVSARDYEEFRAFCAKVDALASARLRVSLPGGGR